MPIHIGAVSSRVTVTGHEAALAEQVVDLVLERLRGDTESTVAEEVIRDRLTTER